MKSCRFRNIVLALAFSALPVGANAQSADRTPHIGYVYPAGLRAGTSTRVILGGQYVLGTKAVHISGGDLQVSVTRTIRPFRLNGDETRELRRRMEAVVEKRMSEGQQLSEGSIFANLRQKNRGSGPFARFANAARVAERKQQTSESLPVKLPDHPIFDKLETLSLQELEYVAREMLNQKSKLQQNSQIAETVILEVKTSPETAPGEREIRLEGTFGLTNPIRFEVGKVPEVTEKSLFNTMAPEIPIVETPAVMNGQITPGDTDRFRIKARKGQKLVLDAEARRLVPYLADAVPGWFQATLTLYDPSGKQVAFSDDWRFDPDPVILYEVPADGEYELEIRDALYRGREDFVYRISAGEKPFITGMFPLGASAGTNKSSWVTGWNLPWKWVPLNTTDAGPQIRRAVWQLGNWVSNEVSYSVDPMGELDEKEPNDSITSSQKVVLPQVVNGYIGKPGEVDLYSFSGRAGERVVAEIVARRLQSPLDSLLRLRDARGRVIAMNDDFVDRENALQTHQADSLLSATLPADGTFFVEVSDTQRHGGPVYAYRLKMRPAQPDFATRVTPSSLNIPVGKTIPLWVHVIRKEGFEGDVELSLADAKSGFRLGGARIPRGREKMRITLTAPPDPLPGPVALELLATARINGQRVTRKVVPAEDMMQAFAYSHLVPAKSLMVGVQGGKRYLPPIGISGESALTLPTSGTATVRIQAPTRPLAQKIELELKDPPKGVALSDVQFVPGGATLTFSASADAKPGTGDNLIVEAFMHPSNQNADKKKANQAKRFSIGVLPAIQLQIVQR